MEFPVDWRWSVPERPDTMAARRSRGNPGLPRFRHLLLCVLALLGLSLGEPIRAQDSPARLHSSGLWDLRQGGQDVPLVSAWDPGLRLMAGTAGLAIGPIPRVDGLRINWADRELDLVRGVNLTLWRPRSTVGGTVRGLSVGVISPRARKLEGVSTGVLATVAADRMEGIHVGGMAVMGGEEMIGLQVAGGVTLTGGPARGVQIGGLAVVAGDEMDGVQIGGLAVASGGPVRGIQAGGLRVRSNSAIQGLNVAGYAVRSDRADGVTLGALRVDADKLRGLSLGAIQRSGSQRGLAVGLVNWTDSLRGVQIGLLNRAADNPRPFRVLPLINLRL
jgi:hypothetical protein